MSDAMPNNSQDSCSHPFESVVSKGLQVSLADENIEFILTEESVKVCGKCGDILETAGKSDGLFIRSPRTQCPHPYSSVGDETVELHLIENGSESIVGERSVTFCKACNKVVEEKTISV